MRRALGKGLAQLLGEQFESSVSEVPIDAIAPNPLQPRQNFDEGEIEELAASIREVGLLQPLVVRPTAEGGYELIAGERRLRASKRAGLKTVPVLVRPSGDQASLELALIENLQRSDISPVESAKAFRRLMQEFGLTQEQVAERVGKSRTAVANTLRLLRLPPKALECLEKGEISEGHARALLAMESEDQLLALLDRVVRSGMSVRETEKAVREALRPQTETRATSKPPTPPADPETRQLEEGLSMFLGAPVRIERSGVGGRLVVSFYSDDDLERILDILGMRF
ncbi:MAG: ParB/RepB/Spo0J family partition protein [Fimbriimonadales bacterium]|nr:ParB/RepB/Spo0J family partition protein [Fimbriimonadales bacterium]